MFDIRDYYTGNDGHAGDMRQDIVNINDDITSDIENLFSSRFERLYIRDRYKHEDVAIEILHPRLSYPGASSLIVNPDKIRYLLSFYPERSALRSLERIVLRPRYIEVGNVELVALYLRRRGTLVIYLHHPHFYQVSAAFFGSLGARGAGLEQVLQDRLMEDTIRGNPGDELVHIHPLWYILSIVNRADDDAVDKFFIRKDTIADSMYGVLNDISIYFSNHGY